MRSCMQSISRLDIQSLTVFDEVFRTVSVSAAAKSLGTGAPWVSKTLNKLRFILNDDLFVRSGSVLSPTKLAQELEPVIRRILDTSNELSNAFERFNSSAASGTFTLCCDDAVINKLIPKLFISIRDRAPDIKLKFVRYSEQSEGFLRTLMVDMYIGEAHEFSPDVKVLPILKSDMVVAMSINHPLSEKETLSLNDILSHEFCGTNYQEMVESPIDTFLHKKGGVRKISLWTPGYIPSINVIRQNNLLSIVPIYLCDYIKENYPDIVCKPLTPEAPQSQLVIAWHSRVGKCKSHDWLRRSISECLTQQDSSNMPFPSEYSIM